MPAPSFPFPYKAGDRLRVTAEHPYGTDLALGDLVTVLGIGVREETGRGAIPVVHVSTAYGRQILGVDVVEPWDPPTYTPAEPDEVSDAQLRAMAAADPELASWATDADTALGATEPEVSGQLAPETPTGHVQTVVASRRTVGETYAIEDADGDELEVTYCEQQCPTHGREGLFLITINDEEAVLIPADQIDGLIRYLFTRKRHSERPEA